MFGRLPVELRSMIYELAFDGLTKQQLPPVHTAHIGTHKGYNTSLQSSYCGKSVDPKEPRVATGLVWACKALEQETEEYLTRACFDITVGIDPITCDACWQSASQYLLRQPMGVLGKAKHVLCDTRNLVGHVEQALSPKRGNKLVKRVFTLWGECKTVSHFGSCL